ncbi:MAG: HD domain-containing protein [Paracoccaceae bacterium]
MNLVEKARLYAQAAHRAVGQKRKYTGECYTVHTVDVAALVARFDGSEEMVAAAHLHDVVEDTAIEVSDIRDAFGEEVADLVDWLTDRSKPEDGNRAVRKAIDRDRLGTAPAEAQTIKCCDLISNTTSIVEHDPSFAQVYLREKFELLDVMTLADPRAREAALQQMPAP